MSLLKSPLGLTLKHITKAWFYLILLLETQKYLQCSATNSYSRDQTDVTLSTVKAKSIEKSDS